MAEERGVAYILGILSLVLAFFQPLPAIVLGIVGLVQNKKDKSKVAKKLNILGIVFGVIILIGLIIVAVYSLNKAGGFPVY
ncbi:DUF4190 domain-containing protein [Candidatus Pacearchaeota archaeon]|nr:MAG: DUF4190 domain-containing protein [Candidatus Pacearchaeota archaeon]